MRRILFILLLAILSPAPLAAGGKGKTPEEAFTAAQDAYRMEGPRGYMSFLTRDSQKALTGGTIMTLYGVRQYLGSYKATAAMVKDLDAVMKKHGLDEKKLKALAEKDKGPKSADAAIAAMTSLGETIKDGPAFVSDVAETVNRLDQTPPIVLLPRAAELKGVKITGETAKGTLHFVQDDEDKTENIFFRREGGLWRLDFLQNIREAFAKGKK